MQRLQFSLEPFFVDMPTSAIRINYLLWTNGSSCTLNKNLI